jgi:hypothetical protein
MYTERRARRSPPRSESAGATGRVATQDVAVCEAGLENSTSEPVSCPVLHFKTGELMFLSCDEAIGKNNPHFCVSAGMRSKENRNENDDHKLPWTKKQEHKNRLKKTRFGKGGRLYVG